MNQIKSADHPPEEKLLRKAIAEDYLRLGDWASANQAYLEYQYPRRGLAHPGRKG